MDVYGSYDVVVCGGGTSGVAAAIASARTGATTILIERLGALGGQMNVSGPPGFSFAHIFNDRGEQIINGIVGETHDRLLKDGHALPYPEPKSRTRQSFAFVDPDWWGLLIFQMTQESGVELLLHSLVVDVLKTGDTVAGVVVENTSGRQAVFGKVVIDCTGEGDIAARAGAPFEQAPKDDPVPLEPPSVSFTLDGIDWEQVFAYVKANAEEMANPYKFLGIPDEVCAQNTARVQRMTSWRDLIELGGLTFRDLSQQAIAAGDHHEYGDLGFYFTPREGGVVQAIFQHSAQVPDCDCTDIRDMTAGEVEARRQAVISMNCAKKYLPGFQHAYLTRMTLELRIRETRRIMGDYKLTMDDVFEGRKFPDVVGKIGMQAGNRHVTTVWTLGLYPRGEGKQYIKDGGSCDIPYRCLVPKDVENLLVAGKMISTERECYQRFLPETMVTGQAAGTAAALCASSARTPRELEQDVSGLQAALEAQGAVLHGTY